MIKLFKMKNRSTIGFDLAAQFVSSKCNVAPLAGSQLSKITTHTSHWSRIWYSSMHFRVSILASQCLGLASHSFWGQVFFYQGLVFTTKGYLVVMTEAKHCPESPRLNGDCQSARSYTGICLRWQKLLFSKRLHIPVNGFLHSSFYFTSRVILCNIEDFCSC